MTIKELGEILESTGLPVAYRAFPENEALPLPYICYLNPYDNNFMADGAVYSSAKHIQVELYTRYKDEELEERVKQALSSFGYTREEEYLEEEKCYQIIFEMEV